MLGSFSFIETKLFSRIVGDYLTDEHADSIIWMLTVYAKNEANDIAPEILRKIKDEIDGQAKA